MKIPVSINIKTEKQLNNPVGGALETEKRETTVAGLMHTTRDGIRLEYTESEARGEATVTTVNILGKNTVAMNHSGDTDAYMVFEAGKTHSCVFAAGPFPVELRVKTASLVNTISRSGGKLDVDYTVDIIGNRAENSHLTLSVYPHRDTITTS